MRKQVLLDEYKITEKVLERTRGVIIVAVVSALYLYVCEETGGQFQKGTDDSPNFDVYNRAARVQLTLAQGENLTFTIWFDMYVKPTGKRVIAYFLGRCKWDDESERWNVISMSAVAWDYELVNQYEKDEYKLLFSSAFDADFQIPTLWKYEDIPLSS